MSICFNKELYQQKKKKKKKECGWSKTVKKWTVKDA